MDFSVDLSNVKNMYETTFLVNSDLNDQEYQNVVAKFEKIIKDNDGEIVNLEHWGQRRLAYPIGKKGKAYYTFVEFNAPGRLIAKLEQEFRYDEKVVRYLTVKLDKFAAAFNKKRREQGFKKKEKVEAN
jgi:small subunit ribosomal protein S6